MMKKLEEKTSHRWILRSNLRRRMIMQKEYVQLLAKRF